MKTWNESTLTESAVAKEVLKKGKKENFYQVFYSENEGWGLIALSNGTLVQRGRKKEDLANFMNGSQLIPA